MALLQVRGLIRSFYGVRALSGLDLDVAAGTITGLIGPNGAGKTTAFNVISGLVPPDAGTIRFDGRDIAGLAPEAITAAGLTRTFQIARGFPRLTVFENLMLGGPAQPGEGLLGALLRPAAARAREEELAERALAILSRLRLKHVADNRADALSGGQKKLLEIARALMTEPRMLLLDEPIAGVNPTLAGEIGDHLLGLREEGMTCLIIEHHMDAIARLCDPVIVMADGARLTQGSFAEVAADARVQEAYMGRRHGTAAP